MPWIDNKKPVIAYMHKQIYLCRIAWIRIDWHEHFVLNVSILWNEGGRNFHKEPKESIIIAYLICIVLNHKEFFHMQHMETLLRFSSIIQHDKANWHEADAIGTGFSRHICEGCNTRGWVTAYQDYYITCLLKLVLTLWHIIKAFKVSRQVVR